MSIKVKREMSPSAAAAASRMGGRGKRAVEDARTLASLAQRQGGGSTTGATAQAHAQLVSAPTGGGGASLGSLGGFAPAARGGGGGGAVTRMAPKRNRSQPGTNGERLEEVGNGKYRLVTADGKQVLREYNKDEFNDLVRRGSNGVSLSDRDATAFTRWKSSQGILTDEEKRKAAEDAKIAEAEKDRQLRLELQRRQQEHESYMREVDYRNKVEDGARRQAEIEANRDADLQAQKDIFDYKYTQQQKLDAANLAELLDQIEKDDSYSDEEKVELKRQAQAKLLGIKPLPTLKEEPNTPNIQTDADGRKWIESASGRWERIDDGSAQEEKRQEALRARADKYELELMKPYKVVNNRGAEVSVVRTPEEIDAIMRRKFPELYPTADTAGTGQEPPPAPPTDQTNPTPAPATAAPVAGDPASFEQFKKKARK